jgi:ketosteroid isomerase-like protein
MTAETDALAAIDSVIDDFGRNRRDAYFAGFAPDATFLFHTTPKRLESRAEYEALWDEWVRDSGFEVLACESTERRIQIFDGIAIFSHSVKTRLRVEGAEETQHERETIVAELRDGQWLCVHEHLSGLD